MPHLRTNSAREAGGVSASPLYQLPNTYRAFYGTFPALRPFQIEVITPLLQGHALILQAATGSGKTEAVLAPCLERVLRAEGAAGVLYVVPTRALAQDAAAWSQCCTSAWGCVWACVPGTRSGYRRAQPMSS